MDPLKNVGANNYAMTMPQNDVQQAKEEDYSSMPMVYDPTMEEKKESASSGLALKALGAIGLAGLALWGGHAWGSKGVKAAEEAKDAAIKAAEEAKDVAIKAAEEAKDVAIKAAEEAVAKADKLQKANDAAYEIAENGHRKGWFNKSELRKDIKKALKPEEAEAKKTEEAVAEGAKKGEGTAKPEGNPESAE